MFCPNCGAKNTDDASYCSGCGRPLAGQPDPNGGAAERAKGSGPVEKPRLWNPNAIANWSLVFTPIFGSWLNRANWIALGRGDKATGSLVWFWISIVVYGLLVLSPAMPIGLGFIYLVIWYLASGRRQAVHVRERLDNDYRKRGWGGPLLAGLGLFALIIMALMIAAGYGDYAERMKSTGAETEIPPCNARESLELVEQAIRDRFAHEIGKGLMDEAADELLTDRLNIEIDGVRTIGELESGGHQCAARMTLSHGPARDIWEISYTVERTDAGDEIYVSVYRLD